MSINALTSIPQNVVLTTGNGQNYLSWQQVLGATGYTVQSSLTGIPGSFTTVGSPATSTFLDTTVTPGIQYWYQVASNNSGGTSSFASVGTNLLPLTIVPCKPGQINLGYLRYQSKLKCDKLYSEFLTDDEWNFNLNQSAFRLYDLLVTKFGDKYFLAPPVQFSSNGTDVYPLPDGILYNGAPALYKLAGVDAGISAGNTQQWTTLPKFNWIDRNKYATLQIANTVQSIWGLSYCDFGNNIYFIPYPAAQVIRLFYVPMMTQMLQDIDMLPFSISGWSELVIVDAAIKALMKEESFDQASALINERTGLLERIETTAANRDVGQPNTVSNTRARAGDPNFGGSTGGFGMGGYGGGFGWGG